MRLRHRATIQQFSAVYHQPRAVALITSPGPAGSSRRSGSCLRQGAPLQPLHWGVPPTLSSHPSLPDNLAAPFTQTPVAASTSVCCSSPRSPNPRHLILGPRLQVSMERPRGAESNKGVARWRARIKVGAGQERRLGTFATEEAAARAYGEGSAQWRACKPGRRFLPLNSTERYLSAHGRRRGGETPWSRTQLPRGG